jgi:alkylation response protein AidB-like acyl-CoA dehydrogenase
MTDLDRDHVDIRPINKMGRNAVSSNELFIDDLMVPVGDRVGEEGKGFKYILDGLNPTWLYDNGKPCGREANTDKYLCADAGFGAADRALRLHGGMGYSEEYHVSRYFRDSRPMKIAPVSQEMILNFLGEHVLGMPRSN